MAEDNALTALFERHRNHLRAIAMRMLGSPSDADDAVQEAWLRLNRSDTSEVTNPGGWLTTVVSRVCLDMLRSRKSRDAGARASRASTITRDDDPESDLLLADAVGPALLVVLDTLTPRERVAFVLHDVFDVPFDEIAAIVGRSETATRQLASRARRRVQGVDDVADLSRRREVVDAFLAASRDGDFDALLAVLDPDVVARVDATALEAAAVNKWGDTLKGETRGARSVAETFMGRARGTRRALIDGSPGAVWAPGGQPRSAFVFTIRSGKIVAIDLLMERGRLRELDIELVDD